MVYEAALMSVAAERQKVAEQRQQIAQQEAIAARYAAMNVPQRKYGTAVTPQVQQNVLAAKQQAQQYIGELNVAKEQLTGYEGSLSEYEANVRDAQIKQELYQKAYEEAAAGRFSYIPDTQYKSFYEQAKREAAANVGQQLEAQRYQQNLPLIKAGFEPVYYQGQITGYKDVVSGKSVGVSSFENYLKSSASLPQLQSLEKSGLISLTKITMTDIPAQKITATPITQLIKTTPIEKLFAGLKQDIIGGWNLFEYGVTQPFKSAGNLIQKAPYYKETEQVFFQYIIPSKSVKYILSGTSDLLTQQKTLDIGFGKEINLYSKYGENKVINQALKEGVNLIPTTFGEFAFTAGTIYTGTKAFAVYPKISSAISAGIGAYQFKQQTEKGNLGAGLFDLTLGALPALALTKAKFIDIYDTKGMKKINLREETTQGFFKPSVNEKVYMKRYEGFKITDLKTYLPALKGQPKGSFLERQYQIIDIETLKAFQEGVNKFPREPVALHEKFARDISLKEYSLPLKSELPIEAKGKGFGYSATENKWYTQVIGTAGQFYSFKGVSTPFLRLTQGKYEQWDLTFPSLKTQKPTIYAGYFPQQDIIISQTFKEIRIENPYIKGGKKIKKYVFKEPTEAGKVYLPLHKTEVQGVAFGTQIPVREKFYFNLGGRRVRVSELMLEKEISLKQLDISRGMKSYKTSGEYYSTLPSKYYGNTLSEISVLSNISKSSSTSSKSINKIDSGFSNIISKSYISSFEKSYTPSGTSYKPTKAAPLSYIFKEPKDYSYIFKKEKSLLIYPPERPSYPKYNPPKTPPIFQIVSYPSQAKGRIKKVKRKAKKERRGGYAADLTSRILGIAGKVSGKVYKQAEAKTYTGLELRPFLNVK